MAKYKLKTPRIPAWSKTQDTSVLERFAQKPVVQPMTANQAVYLNAIDNSKAIVCTGPAGCGKAQPLHSKILTPKGWTIMGKITVGDTVCTPDGGKATVVGVYPQGELPIYRMTFVDGSSVECCNEHLWKVWCEYKWKVVPLSRIATMLKMPSYAKRLAVPLTVPHDVEADANPLPIDPYTLGYLIGNGSLTQRTTFSCSDQSIVDRITMVAEELDCEVNLIKNCDYSICGKERGGKPNRVTEILKVLGLFGCKSNDKAIPEQYLNTKVENRKELLRGLMDSDGTAGKLGSTSYSTTSLVLSRQVTDLVRSLGGVCSISNKVSRYTLKNVDKSKDFPSFNLNIRYHEPSELFWLTRKKNRTLDYQYRDSLKKRILSVEYVGIMPAQCIAVDHPDHLYITDDYVVTHNTYLACGKAIELLRSGVVSKIILTRPLKECGSEMGFLPGDVYEKIIDMMMPLIEALEEFTSPGEVERMRADERLVLIPMEKMRGRTLKDGFVILDEAQNASFHQIHMFLTRFGSKCKMVICGDVTQSDLPYEGVNSLENAVYRIGSEPHRDVTIVEMGEEDIVRDELVRYFDRVMKKKFGTEPVDSKNKLVPCPSCKKDVWYDPLAEDEDLLVRCCHCFKCIELLDEAGRFNPEIVSPNPKESLVEGKSKP